MIEHQKASIDAEIAKCLMLGTKEGKAKLKQQLVKTLVRAGHTRARAQQLVKENWGKR